MNVNDFTISKNKCDCVIEQATELRALLSYNSDEMIEINKVRALAAINTAMDSLKELKLFVDEVSMEKSKPALDGVISSCEELSKTNEAMSKCNEYFKTSDGFFDYFVNRKTGEKKFKLDENDVEVESNLDDFWRGL